MILEMAPSTAVIAGFIIGVVTVLLTLTFMAYVGNMESKR